MGSSTVGFVSLSDKVMAMGGEAILNRDGKRDGWNLLVKRYDSHTH